uniref:MBD domain-containing protein n=1 Tax=Oryza meridionalis TaxID=40149 RepID=A0A0E0DBX0_9ORYZ
MAGPSVWKGLGVAGSTSIVISDDEKKEIQQDVEDLEEEEERPGWLPDGWIMEVYQGDDGTIYRYYTSPISGLTFTMKSEVLQYLFSGMDERFLESKNCAADNQLINNSVYVSPTMTYMQMTHEWLPKGWIIEVRAGGKNMNKMYKFYVYPPAGVRLFSKEDVLLYINKSEITGFDTNGECDTRTKDNILANVEFNPHSLPEGWVKEVVFRKTKTGVIRKDPYFTDPVNNYSFRTRKSAMLYVQTGKVPKRAFIQRTSVHDLYSFEKSADLLKMVTPLMIYQIHQAKLKKTRASLRRLHAKPKNRYPLTLPSVLLGDPQKDPLRKCFVTWKSNKRVQVAKNIGAENCDSIGLKKKSCSYFFSVRSIRRRHIKTLTLVFLLPLQFPSPQDTVRR